MDYMSRHDGVETLRRLREIPASTPALALTANVMAGTKELLQAAGFVKYCQSRCWRDMKAALLEVLPGKKVIRDSVSGKPRLDAEP